MQQYEKTDEGQKDRQSEAVITGQRLTIVCQRDGRLPLHCQCHHFVTADIAFLILRPSHRLTKNSASLECQSGLTEPPVFLPPLLPDTSACPQSILGSAQLNLSCPLKTGSNINSKLGL